MSVGTGACIVIGVVIVAAIMISTIRRLTIAKRPGRRRLNRQQPWR